MRNALTANRHASLAHSERHNIVHENKNVEENELVKLGSGDRIVESLLKLQ